MPPAFVARIEVMLKPLVNDPQGLSVRDGLRELGFDGVAEVRVGKHLDIRLDAPDAAAAQQTVREMCQRLLANQIIETFTYELSEAGAATVTPAAEA